MNEVDLSELERYLRIFQENPDSRVFAPLADLYRRLGRLSDAESIAREGIQRHPYYAGGRVALSHVLLDGGRFDEAVAEAESVVTYYPDNFLARKILVRSLAALGEVSKAKRELEALVQMAPQVASDPELERSIARGALPKNPTPLGVPPTPQAEARGGFLMERTLAEMEPPVAVDSESKMSTDTSLVNLQRRRDVLQLWLQRLNAIS